jgi:hypothetical protein
MADDPSDTQPDAASPRTVYYGARSLDGYLAAVDDDLDWLLGYEGTFEDDGASRDPMSEGGGYERF